MDIAIHHHPGYIDSCIRALSFEKRGRGEGEREREKGTKDTWDGSEEGAAKRTTRWCTKLFYQTVYVPLQLGTLGDGLFSPGLAFPSHFPSLKFVIFCSASIIVVVVVINEQLKLDLVVVICLFSVGLLLRLYIERLIG